MRSQGKKKNFCLHDITGGMKGKPLLLESEPKVEESIYSAPLYGNKPFQELDDVRQHWIANGHCATCFIPQNYPKLMLSTRGGTYLYRIHTTSCRPDQEYLHAVSKIYSNVISELNVKKPPAKNFMLPTAVLALNCLDPESRRLTISGIAKYLRTQDGLLCAVLENSMLSIKSFLVLLLALAINSGQTITNLYMWRALNFEEIPFKGPMPDAKYNNNFRPRPPTVHLNGRKFLEDLKKSTQKPPSIVSSPTVETENTQTSEPDLITNVVNNILHKASTSSTSICEEEQLNNWIQNLIFQAVQIKNSEISCTGSNKSQSINEWSKNLLLEMIHFENSTENIPKNDEEINSVRNTNIINIPSNNGLNLGKNTSKQTNVQNISLSIGESIKLNKKSSDEDKKDCVEKSGSVSWLDTKAKSRSSQTAFLSEEEVINLLSHNGDSDFQINRTSDIEETIRLNKIKACQVYLDFYKHSDIPRNIFREIYKVALSGLCNLKTLSVNYSYLADDTGKTVMSLGSIFSGTLRNIEILCSKEDLPWKPSSREEPGAMHCIPDIAWKKALQYCPKLKVHLVLVSLQQYDEIKLIISKSMPLISFLMDTGFPEYELKVGHYHFGCTFKVLSIYFAEILENAVLVLWRASSRLDTVYLKFLKEMKSLITFELFCYVSTIETVENMCELILQPGCGITYFKMSLQEDPCYPEISRKSIANVAEKFKQRFIEKGVELDLDTFKK